jgi:hypothetical protein
MWQLQLSQKISVNFAEICEFILRLRVLGHEKCINMGECLVKVPMLAAQGMKAVANLFQPEAPTAPETLDRPHLAVPGGSGYPRRDAGNSAGSRILASIWPYLDHVAFKVLSSDASLSLSFLTFIYFYYTFRFCLCLLVLMFSITL